MQIMYIFEGVNSKVPAKILFFFSWELQSVLLHIVSFVHAWMDNAFIYSQQSPDYSTLPTELFTISEP